MPEVLIAGGGPAGAASARWLASWGHDVVLVAGEQKRGAIRALAVSLPPSAGKLFDTLGVSQAVDDAGFVRSTGNTVWWGGESRVEGFGDGRLGWQATTDRLEQVLQAEAAAAGARIDRRTIAAGDIGRIAASFYLDCTGRAGVLARPLGVRQMESHLRSIALVAEWRYRDADWIPDDTHTLIESYADGWAWSVPVQPGVRHVAVMVDPRTSNLSSDREARTVYLAEIAKTRHIRALTSGEARLDAGPRGWDASMYRSSRYVEGDTLLVGDAGSFVDPLSSAGVRKALVSAWVASIAVHTTLLWPERRELALRFYDDREAALYAALRQLTADHLADAARDHDAPFWVDRSLDALESGFSRTTVASGFSRTTVASGFSRTAVASGFSRTDEDQVRAAYEDLRRRPRSSLQLAPGVAVEPLAIIEGREIVSRPHLVPADGRPPLRFLYDVEIPALIEVAALPGDAGMMFDAYCRLREPVPLPQFLTALSALVARGWLCYKDHTEGSGS